MASNYQMKMKTWFLNQFKNTFAQTERERQREIESKRERVRVSKRVRVSERGRDRERQRTRLGSTTFAKKKHFCNQKIKISLFHNTNSFSFLTP